MIFWGWLLSLSMFSGSIHVVACASIHFCCWMIFCCMDRPHVVYPSVNGHLICLHFLAIINNAAMNICVTFFCMEYVCSSFVYIPRSEIPSFTFWGTAKLFSKVSEFYISTSNEWGAPISPHPWHYLLLSDLFNCSCVNGCGFS